MMSSHLEPPNSVSTKLQSTLCVIAITTSGGLPKLGDATFTKEFQAMRQFVNSVLFQNVFVSDRG